MSQRSVIQQCKSCWSQGPYRYCWYWCAVPPLIPGTPITMAHSPESTMTILMLVVLAKFSGPFFWFLLIWSHLGSQPGQILPYLADSHPGGTNIGNFEFLMNPSPRSTWSRFFCFNPPYIWFGLGRNLESKFQPSQILSYLAINHVERWKEDSAFRYFRPPQFSSNVTTRAAAYQIASWKFQVFCLHYLDKFNP